MGLENHPHRTEHSEGLALRIWPFPATPHLRPGCDSCHPAPQSLGPLSPQGWGQVRPGEEPTCSKAKQVNVPFQVWDTCQVYGPSQHVSSRDIAVPIAPGYASPASQPSGESRPKRYL